MGRVPGHHPRDRLHRAHRRGSHLRRGHHHRKLPQQLRGHLLLGRHLQPHLPVQLHAAAAVQCEEDQRCRRDGQI